MPADPEYPHTAPLPEDFERVFHILRGDGIPVESLLTYGRWWQLERWLRTLVYLELRTRFGSTWQAHLPPQSHARQQRDRPFDYMPTPDVANPVAYLDVTPLLKLIQTFYFRLFRQALLPKSSLWKSRIEELGRVRNRLMHVRRPHPDDRSRLEQLLRDLEAGARRAIFSYNRSYDPSARKTDPVVKAWIECEHPYASRLVDHGARNKGIHFDLRYSVRPWAKRPPAKRRLAGAKGILWDASVHLSERRIDLRALWESDGVHAAMPFIVHVLSPSIDQVRFTFPAVDSPDEISDAIGHAFEAVFACSRPLDVERCDYYTAQHSEYARHADSRVLVDHGLAILDDSTMPVTIFGA